MYSLLIVGMLCLDFAHISDLKFWLAFVWSIILVLLCQHSFSVALVLFKHLFIDVRLFHCIIIEHILECLVWWHYVSYVGYYLTLGHTLILEFIDSPFTDFLAAHSISWPLWVVILRHTLILEFINVLQTSLITRSISWSLLVVILGHTPFSALLLGYTPIFGFTTSRADFMVVRPISRSLQVIT